VRLFKQKSTRIYNGTKVKKGDRVMFINSDGQECIDEIRLNQQTKELYFWNNQFKIEDYQNAVKL